MSGERKEGLFRDCLVGKWRVSNAGGGDLQGQPQCRRNATRVGFPSASGNANLSVDGAFDPISGAGDTVREVGGSHEASSCWKVIAVFTYEL